MVGFITILVGILLIAHGLIHLLYVTPPPDDPAFPFTLRRSWLLPPPARRPAGIALIGATVAAFALVALAVWDLPGLREVWPALTIVAAAVSLVTLITFWNARLILGVVIDLALIAVAAIRPEWAERIAG